MVAQNVKAFLAQVLVWVSIQWYITINKLQIIYRLVLKTNVKNLYRIIQIILLIPHFIGWELN